MRKIVYHIAISVDGFIAAENGSVEDFYMTGEHANDFVSQLQEYDTVIMGKNTYAFGFQFGLQPGKPAYTGLKHIIVSTTMHFENSDDVTLLKTNAIEQINEMKKKKGKD
ncbi:MAG: dihydrofolate reductase family protein, partial [Cyclobacteriaceae bacterium]|nr:dihydrofolate reductase family protein [Cyclobacteriaceae bacterium HetDA_MAG_MS6]